MSDIPKDVARLMKRCQIGVGGRNAIDDAHDIMAECYGTLGKLSADLAALTRERDSAYERGLAEGRIDLEKIVRKWDSECLDPPEVEGLRDYAMLDGERLETLWRAFELAMAREMQMTRERDETRQALASFDALFRGARQLRDEAMKERDEAAKERDALRAEVERLRSVIPSLIVVQRMPNAEHVADAHNDAVRVLRAALQDPTP